MRKEARQKLQTVPLVTGKVNVGVSFVQALWRMQTLKGYPAKEKYLMYPVGQQRAVLRDGSHLELVGVVKP